MMSMDYGSFRKNFYKQKMPLRNDLIIRSDEHHQGATGSFLYDVPNCLSVMWIWMVVVGSSVVVTAFSHAGKYDLSEVSK